MGVASALAAGLGDGVRAAARARGETEGLTLEEVLADKLWPYAKSGRER